MIVLVLSEESLVEEFLGLFKAAFPANHQPCPSFHEHVANLFCGCDSRADGETVVGYQNSPVWSEGCLLDLDAEGIHSLDEALVEVLLVFVWIMC